MFVCFTFSYVLCKSNLPGSAGTASFLWKHIKILFLLGILSKAVIVFVVFFHATNNKIEIASALKKK